MRKYLVFSETNDELRQKAINKILEVASDIINHDSESLNDNEEAIVCNLRIKKVNKYYNNSLEIPNYFISGHIYNYIFNIKLDVDAEECVSTSMSSDGPIGECVEIVKFYKGTIELYNIHNKEQLVYKNEISSNRFM